MTGLEVRALVGPHSALVSEPVVVKPAAYTVRLGNAGRRLLDGKDFVESLARDDLAALPCPVVREHLREAHHVRRSREKPTRRTRKNLRLPREDELRGAPVRTEAQRPIVRRIRPDNARCLFRRRREGGVAHSERIQDALLQPFFVRHSNGDLKRRGGCVDPGVSIAECLARLRHKRNGSHLTRDLAKRDGAFYDRRREARAACVRDEVADRQRTLRRNEGLLSLGVRHGHLDVGELGQELRDFVVERQPAVVDRRHERRAVEGLCHRENCEERVGTHRDLVLHVRPTCAIEAHFTRRVGDPRNDAGDKALLDILV